MKHGITISIVATCAALASATPEPGGVSVFCGSAGSSGNVKVFDETLQTSAQFPSALQGIRLEPIDFAGRTELNAFQPDMPRRVTDVPNAGRLLLPHGQGSLYRYSKSTVTGDLHGFMLVDATGIARSVFEFPSSSSGADPFIDRVAIAPGGDAMLVATTVAAGGDLYEVEFASASATNRTSMLAAQDFSGAGIGLGANFGIAVSSNGILRFDRATKFDAQVVDFSNALVPPTWFMRELVLSYNGLYAATVAGASSTEAHVYVIDACNDAIEVDPIPREILGAGFEPESIDGPYLAVSDDGKRAAWVALEIDSLMALAQEAYVAAVPMVTTGGSVHVTNDGIFHPFLDEVGLYGFTPSGRLHLGVGDPKNQSQPNGTGLTSMDCFLATIPDDAAGLTVENLTLSANNIYPPYLGYPTLDPQNVALAPDRSVVIVYSIDSSGSGQIIGSSTDGHGLSPQQIANNVEELWLFSMSDTDFVYSIQDDNGVESAELSHVPLSIFQGSSTIMPIDDGDQLGATTVRSDGWAAVVAPDTITDKQQLWRIQTTTAQKTLFTHRAFDYGPTVGFTPLGSLTFSVGEPDHPNMFVVWPLSGNPKRLQSSPMVGFVLPGS